MHLLCRGTRRTALVIGATFGLSACSGDLNPVRDVAVATGMGAQPRKAADFVAKSRPEKLEYVPVGSSAPPRASVKAAAAVSAAEAEMDALRAANEARAAEARAAASASPTPSR